MVLTILTGSWTTYFLNVVEIDRQVKIVYVGAKGIVGWDEVGVGIERQRSGLQALLSYKTRLEMGYYI